MYTLVPFCLMPSRMAELHVSSWANLLASTCIFQLDWSDHNVAIHILCLLLHHIDNFMVVCNRISPIHSFKFTFMDWRHWWMEHTPMYSLNHGACSGSPQSNKYYTCKLLVILYAWIKQIIISCENNNIISYSPEMVRAARQLSTSHKKLQQF